MGDVKQKSLKVNFLMNLLLTVSSFIFPLITFMYTSRVLGPYGTGTVAFCASIVNYFALFSQLGIQVYGVRVCAGVRDDIEELSRTVQELLVITLSTSLAAYAALAVCVICIPELYSNVTLICVLSSTILLNTLGVEWLYKALEEYTYITIRSICMKLISVVLLFFIVTKSTDYVQYGLVTVLASSASNICNLIMLHRHVRLKPQGRLRIRRHFKPLLLLFATTLAVSIYTNLDISMLGFMSTEEEAGYYNAAVSARNVLTSLVASLGVVLMPRAAYYVENDKFSDFVDISRKALQFVLYSSIPIAVFFAIFSSDLILVLAGEAFLPSSIPLSILTIAIILVGLSNITGSQMLVALKADRLLCISTIFAAVVDFLLNLVLIPPLRSIGTAVSTVIAEGIVLGVQINGLRGKVNVCRLFSVPKKEIGATLLALIPSFASLFFLEAGLVRLILAGGSFFVLYLLVTYKQRVFFAVEIVNIINRALAKTGNAFSKRM